MTPLYKKLSGTKTKVNLVYEARWTAEQYESKLLKELEHSLELDIARGFTAAGPHREDLAVLFNGRPAQETASRGEIRTAVLALKIIELQILEEARDTTPLLLLDDVFSELDGRRRHALTDHLSPYQTFITTTDADTVIGHFTETANIIPVHTTK
jgi:DNA replication and repair protein RecF